MTASAFSGISARRTAARQLSDRIGQIDRISQVGQQPSIPMACTAGQAAVTR